MIGRLFPAAVSCFVALLLFSQRKKQEKKASYVPVLDLRKFLDPHEQARFILDLRKACHEVGFFYLAHHGINRELCNQVFSEGKKFFGLDLIEKIKVENVNSRHFRGYSRVGAEVTRGKMDYREQIEFGFNRPVLDLGPNDPKYLRLIGPNQYPDPKLLPQFQETIDSYIQQVCDVGKTVMSAIALALDLPADLFAKDFEDPYVRMKLIHYPPLPQGEGHFGVGPHRDYGWLTFLMQDDVGGLQVQKLDGEWVDVTPIPDTFVVNLGEMLQLVTDNYFRATPHQVKSKSSSRGRLSVPVFYNPNLRTEVKPIFSPSEEKKHTLEPVVFGVNVLKGLTRTHAGVVRRHYSDLTSFDVQTHTSTI